MGMKLAPVTESFDPAEDHTWLGSRHGTDIADSITLRGADFLSIFTDGIVPSGVVVSKLLTGADAGLYVPYSSVGPTVKVQTLTRASVSGTLTLSAGGETTAVLTGSAAAFTAAAVTAALNALSNIDNGDFVAVDTSATVITITGEIPTIAVNDIDLGAGTDTIVAAVSTAQVAGSGVPSGHLFTTTDVGTGASNADTPAALLWHGEVVESKLPTNHGLTTAAKSLLPLIRYA